MFQRRPSSAYVRNTYSLWFSSKSGWSAMPSRPASNAFTSRNTASGDSRRVPFSTTLILPSFSVMKTRSPDTAMARGLSRPVAITVTESSPGSLVGSGWVWGCQARSAPARQRPPRMRLRQSGSSCPQGDGFSGSY